MHLAVMSFLIEIHCLIFLANLSSDPVIVVMADSEPPSENPFRHLPIVIILLIIIKVTIIFLELLILYVV